MFKKSKKSAKSHLIAGLFPATDVSLKWQNILFIIRCHQLIPTGGNRILVNPGGNLGFGWALLRKVVISIKISITFAITKWI